MLKRFTYLDTEALSDYVSALEDGVRQSMERRDETVRSTFADTPQAQFERMLSLAKSDTSLAGWRTPTSDQDFETVEIGNLIEVECDLYVPDIVKALAPQGGLMDAMEQFEALLPAMSMFGTEPLDDLPSREQRDAVRLAANSLGGKQIVVGELDQSEWRLAGQLESSYVRADVEGQARLVGKVSSIWKPGQWKPLLALPGSSLIPREQRRRMERTKPTGDQLDNYLEGPAVMLDVLAIYR
ncbi:hypothetical protein ACF1AO_28770 [Streptomyces longwoodensis]|uniref:DUF6414 family protein n=1 Tax=Streptomyces longwoodensis TaxID=68231 RepID=UPI0037020AA4